MTIEQLTDRNNIDKLSRMTEDELTRHLSIYFKVTRPEEQERKPKKATAQSRTKARKVNNASRARKINNAANEALAKLKALGL